jgi:hypothetical protein
VEQRVDALLLALDVAPERADVGAMAQRFLDEKHPDLQETGKAVAAHHARAKRILAGSLDERDPDDQTLKLLLDGPVSGKEARDDHRRIVHQLVRRSAVVRPLVLRLTERLKTGDAAGRADALVRLASFEESAVTALPEIVARVAEHREAVKALREIGPAAATAVPQLLERLSAGSRSEIKDVIEALHAIAPEDRRLPPVLANVEARADPALAEKVRALRVRHEELVRVLAEKLR